MEEARPKLGLSVVTLADLARPGASIPSDGTVAPFF
jgi:hypothetical protein